jgi:hypothetical protein
LAATLLCGCSAPHGLDPVELDDGEQTREPCVMAEQRDVDILFVIDNSSSMAAEQANLAANFSAFIRVLESADVRANYRIGVTTTDNGHPCCADTTPEGGNLVLSSCKSRLDDFVIDGLDVRDLACNDICSLDAAELEIQPTTTDRDPEPAPRPWLERIDGVKNLPIGTDMADAFACFAPQGIDGCGWESQLESMYLALARAREPTEPSYGFLRPHAMLAVVIVTDEVDCSYDKDWAAIFSADGNRKFWSDPEAEFPTSAVCWNAGVQCVGDPGHYDDCYPVDLDIEGNPAGPEQAVLHPIARYRDRLQQIEADKKAWNPEAEVMLALIGGVGPDGSLVYAEAGDPEFQDQYGIGPGCTGPSGESALPPVRIRALVDEVSPGNLHSICAPDYTGALEAIADEIRSRFSPACYYGCVADSDPNTAILEPDCAVEMEVHGEDPVALLECLRTGDGNYAVDPITGSLLMPNDDVDVCYGLRGDAGMHTSDPRDDLSTACVDYGLNLEFEIAYRPDVLVPDMRVTATCVESSEPELNCPGF